MQAAGKMKAVLFAPSTSQAMVCPQAGFGSTLRHVYLFRIQSRNVRIRPLPLQILRFSDDERRRSPRGFGQRQNVGFHGFSLSFAGYWVNQFGETLYWSMRASNRSSGISVYPLVSIQTSIPSPALISASPSCCIMGFRPREHNIFTGILPHQVATSSPELRHHFFDVKLFVIGSASLGCA